MPSWAKRQQTAETFARKKTLCQILVSHWLNVLFYWRWLTSVIKRNPLGSAALVEKVEDVRVARQKPGEGSSHADRNASADGLHRVHQSKVGERAQQQDVSSPGFHLVTFSVIKLNSALTLKIEALASHCLPPSTCLLVYRTLSLIERNSQLRLAQGSWRHSPKVSSGRSLVTYSFRRFLLCDPFFF